MSYTKGPWHWNHGQTRIELLTLGKRACVLSAPGHRDDIAAPSEPDAHLISAPPERLEELERVEALLHDWLTGRPQHIHEMSAHMLVGVRRVLAKARGEKNGDEG